MASTKRFELSRRMKLGVGRGFSPGQIMKISSISFLVLAGLLSINAINLYSNRVDQVATPKVLGASNTEASNTDTTKPQFTEYKVKKGETLFGISQQFKVPWTSLATLNNLEPPFNLQPGQTLKIPTN